MTSKLTTKGGGGESEMQDSENSDGGGNISSDKGWIPCLSLFCCINGNFVFFVDETYLFYLHSVHSTITLSDQPLKISAIFISKKTR